MKGEGILDTSAFILASRLGDPEHLPDTPLITTITLAELSVGPLVASDPRESALRQAHLQQAVSGFEPLPFDSDAANAFGQVAADLRVAGRKVRARAYDALIAAVAVSRNLPIYTVNADDFEGIQRLQVVAVPHPDRQ